jgi:hypothetical protein
MILTSLSEQDKHIIKNLSLRFKHKYPHSYNEVDDLIQECYLQFDYIKTKHDDSKSNWNNFLTNCLWNHLNKLCMSTSSPLSLRPQTAKNALKKMGNVFNREPLAELPRSIPTDTFIDLSEKERDLLNKFSFRRNENTKLKKRHKKVIKQIKEKLSE